MDRFQLLECQRRSDRAFVRPYGMLSIGASSSFGTRRPTAPCGTQCPPLVFGRTAGSVTALASHRDRYDISVNFPVVVVDYRNFGMRCNSSRRNDNGLRRHRLIVASVRCLRYSNGGVTSPGTQR